MPPVRTGLGIQRDDGIGEELVARILATFGGIRRCRRASSDDKLVKFRVIDHGIPDTAATLGLLIPPIAPGLRRHFIELTVLRLVRIAWNRIEAPQVFPGPRINRIHVTAIKAHISTGVADEYLISPNARCTGDHVVLFAIAGFGLPSLNSGCLIDCDKPAV